MKSILNVALFLIVAVTVSWLFRPANCEAKVIVCESEHKRYRFCETEVTGPVRIIKQYSDAPCIEGTTWGYDRYGVWVTNGCRAKFEILERVEREKPKRMVCESNHDRYQYCPVGGGIGDVRLIKQFSRKPCIQGTSWGYDDHGVWVDNGCRGEFAIYPKVRHDFRHGHYPTSVPNKRREW